MRAVGPRRKKTVTVPGCWLSMRTATLPSSDLRGAFLKYLSEPVSQHRVISPTLPTESLPAKAVRRSMGRSSQCQTAASWYLSQSMTERWSTVAAWLSDCKALKNTRLKDAGVLFRPIVRMQRVSARINDRSGSVTDVRSGSATVQANVRLSTRQRSAIGRKRAGRYYPTPSASH